MKRLFLVAGLLVLFGLRIPVFAQVIISEIMYDVPGTDAGYEWIEVQNSGSASIDIIDWRLNENETDHYLSLESGTSSVLAPGGYAIIAAQSAKFLESHQNFSGVVFDSVFSLNNTGESLSLISEEGTVDSVYYTPQENANGTGASLQYINGSWQASMATPGRVNIFELPDTESPHDSESSSGQTSGSTVSTTKNQKPAPGALSDPFEPYYTGTLTIEPVILAGDESVFDFEMSYYREINRRPLIKHSGTFIWNMGDGNEYIQDWEEKFQYVYQYPGTYTLVISYYRSKLIDEPNYIFEASVTVQSPEVSIGEIDERGSIRIDNNTSERIDLSEWQLEFQKSFYIFPEHTYIRAHEKRYITRQVHGFDNLFEQSYSDMSLLFPTGAIHSTIIPHDLHQQTLDEVDTPDESDTSSPILEEGVGADHVLFDASDYQKETVDRPNTETPASMNTMLWIVAGIGVLSSMATIIGLWLLSKKEKKEP